MDFSSSQRQSDEHLARLSLTGTWYFAFLIDRYEDKLRRYINRLGRFVPEDVEDILQDIFMKTYQNLNGFDASLPFSSWIYRIAHNEAVSFFRRSRARPHGHAVDIPEDIIQNIASEVNILKTLEEKDSRIMIERSINDLDKLSRDIIILNFFEYKSYDEISDILMIPPGTVASRLRRAKEKIQKDLYAKGYIHE